MAANAVRTRLPAGDREGSPQAPRRNPWLLAWLAFLPVAVLRAGKLSEADTFWEIRAGLLTIAHRSIPATDPFSWTMHGKPWTLNSWGFDVVAAIAYRLAGLPGVAWLCAILAMAIAGLILLLARQLGASALATGSVLLVCTPSLVGWLSARPQLIDYVAVLALVMLLRRTAQGRAGIGTVAAAGLLSAGWVNMHAGALLGVAIAGTCAVLLLARRETRKAGWWCVAATGAALAGCFVYPYGIGIIRQTAHVQEVSAGLIAEWRHFDPASPIQDLTLVIGLLALGIAVRRGDAALIAALGIAAGGSILAMRFLAFLVLFAVPVLAVWVSRPSPVVLRYLRSRRVMFRRCGAAGLAVLSVIAMVSLTHIGRPDPAAYPAGLVRDIPAGCRLFSTDILGSFVILERPDVPVSLDTRNDLYGRARLLAEERTLHGLGNVASGLRGAGCVLVPPAYGLAGKLTRDPGWQVRGSAAAAVLFVRR